MPITIGASTMDNMSPILIFYLRQMTTFFSSVKSVMHNDIVVMKMNGGGKYLIHITEINITNKVLDIYFLL